MRLVAQKYIHYIETKSVCLTENVFPSGWDFFNE